MNRIEAKAKCEELGLGEDLAQTQLESLSEAHRELWIRSRIYLEGDDLPAGTEEWARERARQLQRSQANS